MNAIYGTILDSLIYYKKFVKTLKSTGFQLNKYYPCVANHLIKDKRQTIWFHLYDCKFSHQYSKVNEKFINSLHDDYESVFDDGAVKMKLSQGKVHDYLVMTLDYSVMSQFKIKILDYIKEILEFLDKV